MAYITDRIVSIFARSYVTLEIVLHVVYVRAGVGRRHNQIFLAMHWASLGARGARL